MLYLYKITVTKDTLYFVNSQKIHKKSVKLIAKYEVTVPMYVYDIHRNLLDRGRKEEKLKEVLRSTGKWVEPVEEQEQQKRIPQPTCEMHVLCTPLVPARYGWLLVIDKKTKQLVVNEELDILKDTPEGPEYLRVELYSINGLEVSVIDGNRCSVCSGCGDVHINLPYYHCAYCDEPFCVLCMKGSVRCELCKMME